eukprot:jgi/Bigna1/86317/estExt_fgenesh1_pg.C_90275
MKTQAILLRKAAKERQFSPQKPLHQEKKEAVLLSILLLLRRDTIINKAGDHGRGSGRRASETASWDAKHVVFSLSDMLWMYNVSGIVSQKEAHCGAAETRSVTEISRQNSAWARGTLSGKSATPHSKTIPARFLAKMSMASGSPDLNLQVKVSSLGMIAFVVLIGISWITWIRYREDIAKIYQNSEVIISKKKS